mgnify:CR=1 FL=1
MTALEGVFFSVNGRFNCLFGEGTCSLRFVVYCLLTLQQNRFLGHTCFFISVTDGGEGACCNYLDHLGAICSGTADIVNGMSGLHSKLCGFCNIFVCQFFLCEEFFRFHGVALVEKNHLPQDLPHGAWGAITDAPLYGHAFDDAAKRGGPQYNFVATLASHMPFDLPQDMPPALDKKVEAACHAPKELGIDDCHRIKTLAYADETLAAFVTRIEASPTADRTLLLLSADHSTNDNFVWDTKDRAGSLSRIPMILRVPEATLAAAPHPEEATAALTELQTLALSRGLSNADIPTIVLALLAGTRPMVTLEAPWRWHTLGAQTTRPAFRAPPGLRHESLDAGGAITFFGVNAPAHMFWGEEGGAVHDTEVRNTALATTSDLEQPPPHARAPLAFLGAFLDGWGSKCAQTRWLRRDVRERRDGLDRRQP